MKRLTFTLAFMLWASLAAAQTHIFNLSWTLGPVAADKHDAPTGIKVERKQGTTGTFAEIAKLGVVSTTQDVVSNPVPGGVQYCFRIREFNAVGDGPYSNEACGTTAVVSPPPPTPTPPQAPTGFTVSAISSSTLRLSWADNSDNETGFQIQGKRNTGQPYAVVANLGPDVGTWDWTKLQRYKTYCARVRAVNDAGSSAWTPPSCGTTSK